MQSGSGMGRFGDAVIGLRMPQSLPPAFAVFVQTLLSNSGISSDVPVV
jgi:hypothetical protein